MNTKGFVYGVLTMTAVVAPVVIGRFGGELADLLRIEVLLGFGVVATLVALIILEYRIGANHARWQRSASRPLQAELAGAECSTLVELPARDQRAAA